MTIRKIFYLCIATTILSSCYKEKFIPAGEGLADWSVSTHSSAAVPNYALVFPQDKVNRFDISIDPSDWADLQEDLDNLYGGSSAGGPGGPVTFAEDAPIYVPCNLEFGGLNWYHVGIRYKGNSSLNAYSSGENKLPFRLEFDQFADGYPEITGQTFYGFPALSLSSNYNDKSFLREKYGCDLFREFGVPSPYASFYELYIDYGDGPVYYGLYTVLEVVFETVLDKQFGSNSGNCYKPENDGATFSTSGFNLADFDNKTNSGTGGNDVQALYDALHSDLRTSNEELWKSNLEAVFDVDGFLKWLAVNTTIQNWDTYGRMSHNYYLYHDPADDHLKWIPWDNNEAFQVGKQGGALSFEFTELTAASWPLISYIHGVDEYENQFKSHIIDFITGPFEPTKVQADYAYWQSIIQSSVEAETADYSFINSIADFNSAITTLNSHVETRVTAAGDYAY
jgi:spore coat protein H